MPTTGVEVLHDDSRWYVAELLGQHATGRRGGWRCAARYTLDVARQYSSRFASPTAGHPTTNRGSAVRVRLRSPENPQVHRCMAAPGVADDDQARWCHG